LPADLIREELSHVTTHDLGKYGSPVELAQHAAAGIPGLSVVFDASELRAHLTPLFDDRWPNGLLRVEQVHILKTHFRSRCTTDVGLMTAGGPDHLICKAYAEDRSDVYRAMQEIERAGFGPREEFSIPQAFAYLPALNLLVQEKVDGPQSKAVFVHGNEEQQMLAAERCARWLARFQSRAPRTGRIEDREEFLTGMATRAGAIAAIDERLGRKAARLFGWLEASVPVQTELCAGHGSYSPAQVILGQDRPVTVDWDGFDLADPARDAARFLGALRRLALDRFGSVRALDSAAEMFLATYLELGPPDAAINLRFHRVSAFMRLCSPRIKWREKLDALLDEGLQIAGGV